MSAEERAEFDGVPERFHQFWTDHKTTARERKRVVRFLIEDVTVHKTDQIVAHIRAHREERGRPSRLRFLHRLPNRA